MYITVPNSNVLGWLKLKAIADNKLNVIQNINFVFDRVENTMGKGENAGYQHVLILQQCFQKIFSCGASKVVIYLAVFVENPRYCYSLGIVVAMQKLTFCHISAITEHIYVPYKKRNMYCKGDNSKFIFARIMPLFWNF